MSSISAELPEIHPCTACGNVPTRIASSRPPGRLADIYRVECDCGAACRRWSVTEAAAVRMWNYVTAAAVEDGEKTGIEY